jgi:flagellum-specific ATP synthase
MSPIMDTQRVPAERWQQFLADYRSYAKTPVQLECHGTLIRVAGLVLEAAGLRLPVGSLVSIVPHDAAFSPDMSSALEAEVVGFAQDRLFLMPTGEVHGLAPGARVIPKDLLADAPVFGVYNHPWRRTEDRTRHLPMGEGLLGRVVDSCGVPLDRKGPLSAVKPGPIIRRPINAMDRDPVREPLDTGVRAINALLSVGRGQRLGLFAGSGVGKSVLLGMMARHTRADVTVIGLIGERGREVREFIEEILGEDGIARAVVVAAPADAPPILRMQGAAYATAIAEHFRDQGKNVLLLIDSLTRYAMAQREIALAIGEPPATKGYPPSAFAKLPQLVERAGNGLPGRGSITAFYTVLAEGDDQQDPIADAARAILDGHFVLTRRLAEEGHYPAIDIEQSISRVMHNVVSTQHFEAARDFKALWSRFSRSRELLSVGAYVPGADPELDRAIQLAPQMQSFLRQTMREGANTADSVADLAAVLGREITPDIGHAEASA